jgi:hypothetical protein
MTISVTPLDRVAALEAAIVAFIESEAWLIVPDLYDHAPTLRRLCGGCGQAWDGSYDMSGHPVDCPVAALWRSVQE